MRRVAIAVLQFPGLNCEAETLRELARVGVQPALVRWNESSANLSRYAGFVIPGGFSYQDRIRAGAIAAKSPLLEEVVREVEKGKPILGICNGAQILVEAGLVPGDEAGRIDVCLAPNRVKGWSGYHARWVFVKPESQSCFFTEDLHEPFPVVVAHGEGRFTTGDKALWNSLHERGRFALRYCSADGESARGFPENPNGVLDDVAGMSGLDGQVLAFMPHPERAALLWQVPEDLPGVWGERRRAAAGKREQLQTQGPGHALLAAFRRLEGRSAR
jgi:phosphoribosylformylglycinamidine synthase